MKDYLPGNFIQISKERREKEAQIERNKSIDLSQMISYCLVVPSATPVVIFTAKPPTKKQLKYYVDKFTGRDTPEKKSWSQQTTKFQVKL